MMDRLQSLFNRLAGISGHDARMRAEGGAAWSPLSFAALEKPACWRRRPRRPAPAERAGSKVH